MKWNMVAFAKTVLIINSYEYDLGKPFSHASGSSNTIFILLQTTQNTVHMPFTATQAYFQTEKKLFDGIEDVYTHWNIEDYRFQFSAAMDSTHDICLGSNTILSCIASVPLSNVGIWNKRACIFEQNAGIVCRSMRQWLCVVATKRGTVLYGLNWECIDCWVRYSISPTKWKLNVLNQCSIALITLVYEAPTIF